MKNQINPRYFQWVVGDRKGEVMVFDKIESEDGNLYIRFKDNSRINEIFVAQLNAKDLTGKMMAEVDSPTNIWTFKEEIVGEETGRVEIDAETGVKYEVPSVTEIMTDGKELPKKKKLVKLIPPHPTPPQHSSFGQISNVPKYEDPPLPSSPSNKPEHLIPESNIDKSDPVYILISKSKKNDIEVTMVMDVSLPSKSLYDISKESFEDGDEKFMDYIIDDLSIDAIKKALKIAIKEMYEGTSKVNNDNNDSDM